MLTPVNDKKNEIMKRIYLIIFISTLQSCYAQKQSNLFTENLEFKKQFFSCISNIEAYTLNKKNQDSMQVDLPLFKSSLTSISRFTEVNYTLLANYYFMYPNYEIFRSEKEKWIKWYEENKYKNLKW